MADSLNLDDIQFTGEAPKADPAPRTNKTKSTRPVGRPSRETKVKEVTREVESLLKMANLAFLTRDMHEFEDDDGKVYYATCLSVYVTVDNRNMPILTPEGKNFCEAFAEIAVDSNFIMKMLEGGDTAGKWLRLTFALQPLVMNIIQNHRRG